MAAPASERIGWASVDDVDAEVVGQGGQLVAVSLTDRAYAPAWNDHVLRRSLEFALVRAVAGRDS